MIQISAKTKSSPNAPTKNHSFDSNMHFMDESFLSDSDLDETEITFNTYGPYHELSEFASQFHRNWAMNTEKQKRSASYTAHPIPFRFSFENLNVTSYQMTDSDDEENNDFSDEEENEIELLEIHGKAIPIWASRKYVLEHLRQQENEDPNLIFKDLPTKCSLKEIFDCPVSSFE